MKVAGALLASSLALAGLAVPAQAQPSGAQRFTGAFKLTNAESQPVWSVVVANGVINDHGTLQFGDDNGVIHQDLFILSRGTIVLTEPANPTTDVFHFDPVSCVGSDIATGTYQMSGTGDYAGVTGQGTYRHHAIIIAPHKPGCSPADPQTVGYVTFQASGTASTGE